MITSNRGCGLGPLTQTSACTLVPPGSDETALLRRKTQFSVSFSSHITPSMIVGSSVSVWVGAGDFLSGRRYGAVDLQVPTLLQFPLSLLRLLLIPVGAVVRPCEGHFGWS